MIKFPLFSTTGLGVPAELVEPPQFLKDLKQGGDVLALYYWINALAELKAAALAQSPIRLGLVLRKLEQDGHKAEVEELLAHIQRVKDAFVSHGLGGEVTLLLVDFQVSE
jgi:hypothetical protein